MSYFYDAYEKPIYEIDNKICQKEDELNKVFNLKENDIMKNTLIKSITQELVELRNQRSYYSNVLMGVMMSNCTGGCCGGKCSKYY